MTDVRLLQLHAKITAAGTPGEAPVIRRWLLGPSGRRANVATSYVELMFIDPTSPASQAIPAETAEVLTSPLLMPSRWLRCASSSQVLVSRIDSARRR